MPNFENCGTSINMFCVIQNAEGKMACSNALPFISDQNSTWNSCIFYFDALLVAYGDSPQKWVIIGYK